MSFWLPLIVVALLSSAFAPTATVLPSPLIASAKSAEATNEATVAIRLKPWSPDSAYARRLRDAEPANLYRIYLDERASHANSTAFFLDVADLLQEKGQKALALRVLSNLAEMNLENRHLLRILGYRLMQAGEAQAALPVQPPDPGRQMVTPGGL